MIEHKCVGFAQDGAKCLNGTLRLDRLCGRCAGFTQVRPTVDQPNSLSAAMWLAKSKKGLLVPAPLDVEEAYQIEVRAKAIDAFAAHHGTSKPSAEAQIRSLLEDLILQGECRRVAGLWILIFRKIGLGLVLADDAGTVNEYFTPHLERTWAQIKAGVPSRITPKRRKLRGWNVRELLEGRFGDTAYYVTTTAFMQYGRILGAYPTEAEAPEVMASLAAKLAAVRKPIVHEETVAEFPDGDLVWIMLCDPHMQKLHVLGVHRAADREKEKHANG